jgi:hypothetical protein
LEERVSLIANILDEDIAVKHFVMLLGLMSCGSIEVPRPTENTFLQAIRQELDGGPANGDRTVKVSYALVDLDENGVSEGIAYVNGDRVCGSGGCNMYVFEWDSRDYKLVTKLPITRLPIRVLDSKSRGWHDLGVWVQGGGIQPGYEAHLRFNGKSYPANPSMVARDSGKSQTGKIVISVASTSQALYK